MTPPLDLMVSDALSRLGEAHVRDVGREVFGEEPDEVQRLQVARALCRLRETGAARRLQGDPAGVWRSGACGG